MFSRISSGPASSRREARLRIVALSGGDIPAVGHLLSVPQVQTIWAQCFCRMLLHVPDRNSRRCNQPAGPASPGLPACLSPHAFERWVVRPLGDVKSQNRFFTSVSGHENPKALHKGLRSTYLGKDSTDVWDLHYQEKRIWFRKTLQTSCKALRACARRSAYRSKCRIILIVPGADE